MSKQIRKKYSNEFKHEAIGLLVDQGYSKAEIGRSLGINPDLIRRWQREFEVDGSHAFPGQGKLPLDQQRIRNLENENRRLRDGERHPKKGDGLLCARKVMRYPLIDTHKKTWPINLMCQVLNVSTSGYYA